MDRITNARKGIFFGIINNMLTIILPFLSRTIIIYTLGTAYVGLGGLFSSIISVLNITELGFGSAVSYLLYKPLADGDEIKVCAILNFTKKCFRIIGLVILGLGIIVMPFLNYLISADRPSDLNIYILFLIYLVNTVISYMMFSYKRILFSANQRYDIETNISSITFIIQYIFQIFILLVYGNYYVYVFVTILMTIVNNLLCEVVTRKIYPQFFCTGDITKQEIEDIKRKVGGAFFSKIGSTVYLSADNVVISAFFGLIILGKYTNYYYVISSLIAIFAVVHNTLRPILGNCIVTESKYENFIRLKKINHLYLWVCAFCTCCLLCLYQDFITIWIGVENRFPFYMVFLFATYFMVGRISCVPALFVEAAGLWWESKFVPIIAAGLNLSVNILLSKTIGLPGVIISSIMSSILVTFIGNIFVLFKHYFGRDFIFEYIKSTIMILLKVIISCFIVWLLLRKFIVMNWLTLIVKGMLIFLLFLINYFIMAVRNQEAKEALAFALTILKIKK